MLKRLQTEVEGVAQSVVGWLSIGNAKVNDVLITLFEFAAYFGIAFVAASVISFITGLSGSVTWVILFVALAVYVGYQKINK